MWISIEKSGRTGRANMRDLGSRENENAKVSCFGQPLELENHK